MEKVQYHVMSNPPVNPFLSILVHFSFPACSIAYLLFKTKWRRIWA